MAGILKGDIYWADLGSTHGYEQAGRRPVLVLSESVFNDKSGTVIAVALTSQEPRAGFPLSLEIVGNGLPKRTWAKIGQIRTLADTRLGNRLGSATDEETAAVIDGLNEIFGC